MGTKARPRFDMGAIILKGMVIILVVLVFSFILQNWVYADKVLHKTNTLADAFKYCGVHYKELDEKCSTRNYFHCRNAAKKKAIVMYKCGVAENVHYFVGNGDKRYFIKRRFNGEIKEETRTWVIYDVPLDIEGSPLTMLFRAMLFEFLGKPKQYPHIKKPKGKLVNV